MVWTALGFLSGVLWVETRPQLDGLWWVILLASLLAMACICLRARRLRTPSRRIALVLFVIALGMAWAGLRAHWQMTTLSLQDPQRADYRLAGEIVSLPQVEPGRVQFDFAPEAAREQGLPSRVRLSWYDAPAIPRAAERWELSVRLRPPHGFSNPGGFDYEGQLFREGVGAIGYVRTARENRRVAPAGWRHPVLQLRAAIVRRMQRVLSESSARGAAIGLAVGATDEIEPRQWQVFRATGITHLIAISGTHVTMIAALGMLLVRVVWWLPWQPGLRSCRSDVAAAVGAIAAAAYALLAGFSVPTQRTLVMFLVALSALWLRRAQPPSHTLSLALIAVLLLDPHAVLAAGFWLSFLAVAAIVWVVGRSAGERRPLREFFSVQAAVTVILVPATLLLFGGISMVAPAVNVIAIPFFSFLLVPGILLSLALMPLNPSIGEGLLKLTASSFEYFWPVLEGAAKLPAAWMHFPASSPLLVAVLATTAIVIITPLPMTLRMLGALVLLPLFFQKPQQPPEGGLRLTVLDVGQGLAVFVRTRNHTLLYDTGPSFRTGRSAGDLAVVPFLWNAGVARLDMLVVSHPDNDHAGGVPAVMDGVKVQTLRYGGPPTPVKRCVQGESWSWDGVRFEFLHPRAQDQWSDNDGSCLLSIVSGGGRVLLTGDLQSKAESQLIENAQVPGADIVVVPHHGSRTSSTRPFVEATRPRYAIVSAGFRNRWNFPDPAVVERWRSRGAQVLGTAEWGAIAFDIDPQLGIGAPQAHRLDFRRYWHATSWPENLTATE